jgi:hypothetical protein
MFRHDVNLQSVAFAMANDTLQPVEAITTILPQTIARFYPVH